MEINNTEEQDLVNESILESVKTSLGLTPEIKDFDLSIIMNINAAIFTLTQLGVGPENGFSILNEKETYHDFLTEKDEVLINPIKMYLYYKTRLGFDPPTNSSLLENIKELTRELESRISYQVEPKKEDKIQND